MLHGKIDILRAELVARLQKQVGKGESALSDVDLDRLTDILASKAPQCPLTRPPVVPTLDARSLSGVRLSEPGGVGILHEVRRVPLS